VQNAFGLGRSADPLLQICGDQGIAFVPFASIAGSGAGGGTAAEPAGLLAVAAAHDASPAQIRLAWTLHQGRHVLAIPGTGTVEHLEQNVSAAAIRLSASELSGLAAIAGARADLAC
jgi:aryl-alcohol dehydrogenase-like predicted oxidoreductase